MSPSSFMAGQHGQVLADLAAADQSDLLSLMAHHDLLIIPDLKLPGSGRSRDAGSALRATL